MSPWKDHLKPGLVDWLLEPDNASVRYTVLTDILDRASDDPDVIEAHMAILHSQAVQGIFSRQDPAGWWDTPERATGIRRASGQLLILSCLGVPVDERVRHGCEFVLSRPWLPARRPVCIVPCYTANCLRFLARFGYAEDPRVEAGWAAMVQRFSHDDGLRCWYQKHPCHWLAVKALWAFATCPDPARVSAAIARTAEAVLEHRFNFAGDEACWLRFGFPWYYQSDLLDALEALAASGYAADERFRALAQHVRCKQGQDGRWLLQGGSTVMRMERKGHPSKWITVRALRLLKHMEEAKCAR